MSLYAVSEATTHTYETLLCDGSTAVPRLNRDLLYPNVHSRPPAHNVYPTTQMSAVPPEVLQWNLAAVVPQNIDSSSRFFRTFRKGKPKALGIVLIVAAVLQVALGIASFFVEQLLVLYSGVTFWGSIFYIIAGSLTIAAQSKPSMCLVRGSLSLNIISTIVSVIALILISIDLAISDPYLYNYYGAYNVTELQIKILIGYILNFILLFINLLLFCVTLSVSIFGCRSLAHMPSNVTQVFVMQNDTVVSMDHSRVPATYPLPPLLTSSAQYVNKMY